VQELVLDLRYTAEALARLRSTRVAHRRNATSGQAAPGYFPTSRTPRNRILRFEDKEQARPSIASSS
jgi:hypothetical protein